MDAQEEEKSFCKQGPLESAFLNMFFITEDDTDNSSTINLFTSSTTGPYGGFYRPKTSEDEELGPQTRQSEEDVVVSWRRKSGFCAAA